MSRKKFFCGFCLSSVLRNACEIFKGQLGDEEGYFSIIRF